MDPAPPAAPLDSDSLARLIEANRDRLLRLLRLRLGPALTRRVGDEDALHETFLAAQTRLAHAAAFQNPYLWLRVVAEQTAVDLVRRHLGAQARDLRREAVDGHSAATALIDRLPDRSGNPSRPLRRAEALEALEAALATVSAADREILLLRHAEELSNQEAAAVLAISEKAASLRYVRALARLQSACAARGLSEGDLHGR